MKFILGEKIQYVVDEVTLEGQFVEEVNNHIKILNGNKKLVMIHKDDIIKLN